MDDLETSMVSTHAQNVSDQRYSQHTGGEGGIRGCIAKTIIFNELVGD